MEKKEGKPSLVNLPVILVLQVLLVKLRTQPSEEFTVLSWKKVKMCYRAVCFQLSKFKNVFLPFLWIKGLPEVRSKDTPILFSPLKKLCIQLVF